MIKIQYTDPKLVSPQPGHVRLSVGALGGRPEVQGVRQGAQWAAPSLASLEPPGSLPGTQKCLPGTRAGRGRGGGGGEWRSISLLFETT